MLEVFRVGGATFVLLLVAIAGTCAEQHPSFRLDSSAKRKLVEKAAALKKGDSFQTVTNALESPALTVS